MKIKAQFSTIYISTEIQTILTETLKEFKHSKIFVLVDENTKKMCLPSINSLEQIKNAELIEIPSGEMHKTIESVQKVWKTLTDQGADRTSLFINLGGGIIGDLGGFAASTFKRGIDFINIPTSLLSQVDASAGGKTGVNFQGLKNEIGVFNHPKYVIIDSSFNQSLDKRNILSGWAEMLKHALIFGHQDWKNILLNDIKQIRFKELNQLIARSVHIKNHFVEQDPQEKNIRKALNFGHSFGHAFESLWMDSDAMILHGEAVAQGIICESYLSNKICGLPTQQMDEIVSYMLTTYKKPSLKEEDFEKILELMTHDKKSEGLNLNFTLLQEIGRFKINQTCKKQDLLDTLNWYSNL